MSSICEICGKSHDGSFGSGRFCSKSCSSRYSSSINKDAKNRNISNSLKGRLVGINSKRDPKNHIRICSICGNEFLSSKPRKTCGSPECLHKIRSESSISSKLSKEEFSEMNKRSYINGRRFSGGKCKWYSYNGIKVQGTYELRVCRILDEWVKIGKIIKWEYTNDRIQYTWDSDGSSHSYLMDFKVYDADGLIYYIEVKGLIREHDEEKWNSAKSNGINLQVWFLNKIIEEEK